MIQRIHMGYGGRSAPQYLRDGAGQTRGLPVSHGYGARGSRLVGPCVTGLRISVGLPVFDGLGEMSARQPMSGPGTDLRGQFEGRAWIDRRIRGGHKLRDAQFSNTPFSNTPFSNTVKQGTDQHALANKSAPIGATTGRAVPGDPGG